jgi:hypothetical protein
VTAAGVAVGGAVGGAVAAPEVRPVADPPPRPFTRGWWAGMLPVPTARAALVVGLLAIPALFAPRVAVVGGRWSSCWWW